MKNCLRIFTGAAAASLLAFTSFAQQDPAGQAVRPGESHRDALTNPGHDQRLGPTEKASKVIGMAVNNRENEKLGKVNDLAVDLQSGRVVQVILSTGGVLGVGDMLIAVPPGALHYDDANKVIHLDADKEKLKAAPRFEVSKWEELSQPNKVTEVYSYYGQQPYFSTTAEQGQTLNATRTKELHQASNTESRLGYVQKGSKLIGMNVKNLQDEKLGKVDNLIVDLPAGRLVTVIVSSGGFLGLGDELSAVPPTTLRYNAEHDTVLLDTTKEALAKAPHFKSSEWPDLSQPGYAEGVYRAYNVEPYFTTTSGADVNNTARNARDRDNQTLTPGDQGSSASDVETSRQIRKEITATKDFSVNARNVKIITANGRVTLRGPVKNEEEKRLIGEIAGRIAQAQNVDNQLEVQLTPTGRN
jgi:sporulation protein YlmC with PRC-barrel domain